MDWKVTAAFRTLALIVVVTTVSARADTKSVLTEISDTAERLCGDVAQSGTEKSAKVTGDVKFELSVLAKRLGDLGIYGVGALGSTEYQGVVRNQLTTALRDVRDCKVKVFDMLQKKLIPETAQQNPHPVRNPNALYQYGEVVADVQGAMISQGNGTVTFQIVRTAGKADPTQEVEYQDWALMCPDLPRPPPNVFVGQFSGMLAGETCSIIRKIP